VGATALIRTKEDDMTEKLQKQADNVLIDLKAIKEKANRAKYDWQLIEISLHAGQAQDSLKKLMKALADELRGKEWQPISNIDAEEDMRIVGCTIPKITKAGHEVGSFDVHVLYTHEDKWNGWVWHKENGDTFYPTHYLEVQPPKEG
jgi:hypothetical protein